MMSERGSVGRGTGPVPGFGDPFYGGAVAEAVVEGSGWDAAESEA